MLYLLNPVIFAFSLYLHLPISSFDALVLAFVLLGCGIFSFYAKNRIRLIYHALFLLAYFILLIVICAGFYKGFNGIILLFYIPLLCIMLYVIVLNFIKFKELKNELKKH